jgi:putative ABC transport system permease protein
VGGLWLDFRTGLRQLRRGPFVAAVAILTLAVGIGATTAVFSFVAAVLEASTPVHDMDRRVALWSRNRQEAETKRAVSPGDFLEWRARATLVEAMVAVRSRPFNLSGVDLPLRIEGREVSTGYLEFFGRFPSLGRRFTEDDARTGAPRVVILTDRFWRVQMASQPDLFGTQIRLDGEPATIVGILPPDPVDDGILVPLQLDDVADERAARSLFVWARLVDGATLEQARAEMEAIGVALEAEYPDTNRGWTVNTRPLQEEFVGPQARLVFSLLLAMAMAVLLVGCVNIANLLIARGVARQGEVAIRLAIGATRWRVVRQLLVECAVLAMLGGMASVIVARWVLGVLVGSFPVESPWVASAGLNPRMVGVTAVTALLATIGAGLLPAFATRRVSLRSDAHAASRTTIGSARRLTRVLVGGQVALAVMLVMTASLLSRTVGALQRLDPGFDASHLLTASVALPDRTTDAEAVQWFAAGLARASSLPDVTAAGAASRLPFAGSRFNPNRGLIIEGQPPGSTGQASFAVDYIVTPGFFAALRLPIVEGRDFAPGDGTGAPLVAVVNQTLARQRWAGRSPLGDRLRQGDEPPGVWRTVVGVVADVRNDDADQPPLPYLYLPHAQQPSRTLSLVVRTTGDPDQLAPVLRRAMADFDAHQPLFDVRSMQAVLDADMQGSVVLVRVLDAFAVVALGLAGLGIWGVAAQLVAQRTREIGLRVALGATTAQVLAMTARLSLPQVALGSLVGLGMGLGVAQLLRNMLFEVSPTDPASIAMTVAALAGVAALAVAGPAHRAARVDPVVALREE